MMTDPQKEHLWLKKFIGAWTYESECNMGPDQPLAKFTGREVVRAVGDLWIVGESTGEMPGGGPATMLLTVGYDPAKNAYVGSWVGSMMSTLWTYTGNVDPAGRTLTLEATGPSMTGPGTATYQDINEFLADDHRLFTSRMRGDDGQWNTFMTAHYRRVK